MIDKRPLAYRVVVTATLERLLQDMICGPMNLMDLAEKEGAPNFPWPVCLPN
jgi:hypothetical protein